MSPHGGTIEAIERILNRGGSSADVLRAVAVAMHERGIPWVVVRAGAADVATAGTRTEARRVPVVYERQRVGELEASVDDLAFLERVATLISAHVRGAAP